MINNISEINADDVVSMYMSGKSGYEVAEHFGVSSASIYNILRSKGIKTRGRRLPIDESAVIDLYISGVSEKGVADRLGCSCRPVRRILLSNGVHVRSQSESEALKWSLMDGEKRSAQVAAANEAVRNAPKEFHASNAIKQAATKHRTLSKVGHLEREFQAAFEDRGFKPIPQYPFGPYNIDLAIGRSAIEIHGNTCNPHSHPYYRKRVVQLLKGGWHVFYIKTTGKVSIHGAADQVTRMINHAEWNKSSVCQYGVVRGSGDLIATGCLDGDELAVVDGPNGFFA